MEDSDKDYINDCFGDNCEKRPKIRWFSECKSDACIDVGLDNFKETKAFYWWPFYFCWSSYAHCSIIICEGSCVPGGCSHLPEVPDEHDAYNKNRLLAVICWPISLLGILLGAVLGIFNILLSLACCITGCSLKCCGGKNEVAPTDAETDVEHCVEV